MLAAPRPVRRSCGVVRLHCYPLRNRPVTLTPATPPGSPAVHDPPASSSLRRTTAAAFLDDVRRAYLEPQDGPGLATLLASVASAASTSLALAISLSTRTFLGLLRSDFAWYFH